jgi:hypothetical protein
MTIKREAAYHEAAHAVMAHRSLFHALIGEINLENYGAGEIFVSLSKAKLKTQDKPAIPEMAKKPEVASDLARILVAGYVAEQIAAESDDTIKPNIDCARPDHEMVRQQLSSAGLSKRFDRFEAEVRDILRTEWPLVEKVTQYLYQHGRGEPEVILALMT